MNKSGLWRFALGLYEGKGISAKDRKKLLKRIEQCAEKGEFTRKKRLLYYAKNAYAQITGEKAPTWAEGTKRDREFYIITLAWNEDCLLDIYPEHALLQEYFTRFPMRIVGLAADYDEAVKLCANIVETYFTDTVSDDKSASIAGFRNSFEFVSVLP